MLLVSTTEGQALPWCLNNKLAVHIDSEVSEQSSLKTVMTKVNPPSILLFKKQTKSEF